MVRIVPPDGADWTLDVARLAGGVGLVIGFDLAGEWHSLTLRLDRAESRAVARAVLAAGGDAAERTFTLGSGEADG